MKTKLTLAAVAAAITGAAALAHSGATGVVKERMEAMKAMGDAVKAVSPMMRGESDFDAEALREAAKNIEMHSGDAMTELFPEGSNAHPSETLDRVWTDWEAFTALADRLEISARGLAMAADNGIASGRNGMSTASTMGGGSMMGSATMMGKSGGMMGGGAMEGMSAEHIGTMPADAAFAMTSQVCSACHTRFRVKDD